MTVDPSPWVDATPAYTQKLLAVAHAGTVAFIFIAGLIGIKLLFERSVVYRRLRDEADAQNVNLWAVMAYALLAFACIAIGSAAVGK